LTSVLLSQGFVKLCLEDNGTSGLGGLVDTADNADGLSSLLRDGDGGTLVFPDAAYKMLKFDIAQEVLIQVLNGGGDMLVVEYGEDL